MSDDEDELGMEQVSAMASFLKKSKTEHGAVATKASATAAAGVSAAGVRPVASAIA